MAAPESSSLTPATSGFVLAAAITVLFNTVVSCVKDVYAPLKAFLRSIAGHDWTTQGFIDLILFIGLGIIFMRTGLAEKIRPNRLIGVLVGAVIIAGVGLALWFGFV